MSYDIRLVIDTGGERPAPVTDTLSPTYNLYEMFKAALGHPIRELCGMSAQDSVQTLRNCIARMETDPEQFRRHNPANGWGSYEGALETLRLMLQMAIEHPKAKWEI